MKITENQLRRIVREEVQSLKEAGRVSGSSSRGVKIFFSDGVGPDKEISPRDELLPLLLTSEAKYPRVTFLVPDPNSYSEDPPLFDVGGVSFEVLGAPPAGWEDMWWWPLPAEYARPDPGSVRSPRYHSMLDAAVVSLRERQGESLHIFGRGRGMPEVKLRVREIYEDTGYLPKGFSRKWWTRFVNGLKPKRAPVKWLGSDDQMVR